MEDVYFERIAGVGERKPERRLPQGAKVELADVSHEAQEVLEAGQALEEPEIDENGFPVSPLREQEDLWFVQAANLYKPIDKGASVARASGTVMLVLGLLAAIGGLVAMNMVTLVMGLIVATLGSMERSSGGDLARVTPSAPNRLALNQVLVFGLVATYCFFQIKGVDVQTAQALAAMEDRIQQLPDENQRETVRQFVQTVGDNGVTYFFIAVGVVSLIFQGMLAMYYLGKKKRIREFHDELPPWVSGIVKTIATR